MSLLIGSQDLAVLEAPKSLHYIESSKFPATGRRVGLLSTHAISRPMPGCHCEEMHGMLLPPGGWHSLSLWSSSDWPVMGLGETNRALPLSGLVLMREGQRETYNGLWWPCNLSGRDGQDSLVILGWAASAAARWWSSSRASARRQFGFFVSLPSCAMCAGVAKGRTCSGGFGSKTKQTRWVARHPEKGECSKQRHYPGADLHSQQGRGEVIRDGASCTGERDWRMIQKEFSMAFVWDPSQHSPGVISENHEKSLNQDGRTGNRTRVLPNASPTLTRGSTSAFFRIQLATVQKSLLNLASARVASGWSSITTRSCEPGALTRSRVRIPTGSGMGSKIISTDTSPLNYGIINAINAVITSQLGAAVEQWLAHPPPTKAIRARSSAGSIPSGFTPGSSYVGIVLDDAACRRVFSEYSHFPRPCIPTPFHPRASLHVMFRDDGSQLESLSLRGCCLALDTPQPAHLTSRDLDPPPRIGFSHHTTMEPPPPSKHKAFYPLNTQHDPPSPRHLTVTKSIDRPLYPSSSHCQTPLPTLQAANRPCQSNHKTISPIGIDAAGVEPFEKEMARGTELSDFDKGVIVGCLFSGRSSWAIAWKVNRPKSTVAFVLHKWKIDGHCANAARSGRPPILTDRNRRTMKHEIVKNRAEPMATIRQEFPAARGVSRLTDLDISEEQLHTSPISRQAIKLDDTGGVWTVETGHWSSGKRLCGVMNRGLHYSGPIDKCVLSSVSLPRLLTSDAQFHPTFNSEVCRADNVGGAAVRETGDPRENPSTAVPMCQKIRVIPPEIEPASTWRESFDPVKWVELRPGHLEKI
ncbi:hypothetical protein PR048_008436 [Dryococelus australis]|uniref:Uncharacterized protein n=1 Tax=Dryococelus australis TaxID=614101 RepID=A0ABQ9HX35_9NEOP|nr:hypothetical protein PR048_008436 [Dryococelus australis]